MPEYKKNHFEIKTPSEHEIFVFLFPPYVLSYEKWTWLLLKLRSKENLTFQIRISVSLFGRDHVSYQTAKRSYSFLAIADRCAGDDHDTRLDGTRGYWVAIFPPCLQSARRHGLAASKQIGKPRSWLMGVFTRYVQPIEGSQQEMHPRWWSKWRASFIVV